MKKERMLFIGIIIILLGIIVITNIDKETTKELNEEKKISSKGMFAIMVQDGNNGYVESTSNSWPEDMYLNKELTNCVDSSGNKVENVVSYEDGNIVINSKKNVFCYIYFYQSIGDYLLKNNASITSLNDNIEGGMYRYQGTYETVTNNYVCFGTSDKDECLENTDAHIYRIIGITEDGRLKMLKNYALESTKQWYNSHTSDITWPNSDSFSAINGEAFYTNTVYMPSGWSDKIETIDWKYGNITNINVNATSLYNAESAWSNTINAKIGLIYVYDYYYAYQSGGLNCSDSSSYSKCKNAWIHLSVCDSSASSKIEWTISRYGMTSGGYSDTWYVNSDGAVNHYSQYFSNSVRPTFFLKSDIEFLGGTGTFDNPYLIK